MKLSSESHTLIVATLQKALGKYSSKNGVGVITDIYLQPDPLTGHLLISNDDEEVLGDVLVKEWVEAMPENFYADAEMALRRVLNLLREDGTLVSLNILKPYSFVLLDGEKETVTELMLMDDEDVLLVSGELLKGLDEELDVFLKDLLEK